jgi:hypothetical protein
VWRYTSTLPIRLHGTGITLPFYLKEVNHLGEVDVRGKIILKNLKEILCWDVEWIHQAQDMVQWQALVTTVMNLRVL